MSQLRAAGAIVPLLALVLTIGCSAGPEATYPVEGVVRLDDEPLGGGSVMFESVARGEEGKSYTARGTIRPDGSYRLTTFEQDDGAVAGRHRVSVIGTSIMPAESETPVSVVLPPEKYSSSETSGLEFEVKPQSNRIDIDLTGR